MSSSAQRADNTITVNVDPPTTKTQHSAECGITVTGLTTQWMPEWDQSGKIARGHVLDDRSQKATPAEWAEIVVTACEDWDTDKVVAEVNQGGDMVESNIKTHPRGRYLKVIKVRATKNKRTRAEPIAGKYEQARVHHFGELVKLEDQMTQWDPLDSTMDSPDRMDSLVWGLTHLLIDKKPAASYGGGNKPRGPIMPRRI